MKEFDGQYVTIMSCSDCNTKCKHCYVSYKGNFSGQKLYDLASKLKDKYELNINGTEVLLHEDFFDTYNLIGQRRLLSNGIIIHTNPSIIDKIKKSSIEMVAMSYHFVIQNDISSVSNKLLEENIKVLTNEGIKVELMCTVTKDNYDKIIQICDAVHHLGVKKVRFINYLKTGNATKLSDSNVLTDEQKKIFFEQLNIAREKYDKDELLIKRCGSFGYDHQHKCHFNCPAGINKVVIAPDLYVYPCIYMVKPEYRIGYVRDGKVYLDKQIVHHQDRCLASDCYNKNVKVVMQDI